MLAALIGADRISPATDHDAIDGVRPDLVVEPRSIDEASRVLAYADQHRLAVTPRGGGTRMGWGNIPTGADLILSTRRLDRLIEHADGDMTATVEAGITLQALNEKLAERGQFLPLDVPFADRATIGGLISTNDSGPLRLRYGSIRDLLIGVKIVRADGVVAKGGGKVVKNVAGYDLPKLLTGALGTLGLIAEATFRLYPVSSDTKTIAIVAESPEAAGAVISDILGSTLVPTGLAVRWTPADGARVFIRLAGIAPSVAAQHDQASGLTAKHRLEARALLADEAEETWSNLADEPWSGGALVARCAVLPSRIPSLIRSLEEIAARHNLDPLAIIQAHGLGVIRLSNGGGEPDSTTLIESASALRQHIAPTDGTLVLLQAPLGVKKHVDVWGPTTDTLPVMRQIKARFDPNGTLNPGRFVGERP